jgi:hypothetical protein
MEYNVAVFIFSLQDVFLMIRRKKVTIFTDCKDTTTVLELKKMIEGTYKVMQFQTCDFPAWPVEKMFILGISL